MNLRSKYHNAAEIYNHRVVRLRQTSDAAQEQTMKQCSGVLEERVREGRGCSVRGDFRTLPRRERLLCGRFMNANYQWHGTPRQKYRGILTVQTFIASAEKPQHCFMAIYRIDCVAVWHPIFFIIRSQTTISQSGWPIPSYQIADDPVRHESHSHKNWRGP